jgi:hypothetical protein
MHHRQIHVRPLPSSLARSACHLATCQSTATSQAGPAACAVPCAEHTRKATASMSDALYSARVSCVVVGAKR